MIQAKDLRIGNLLRVGDVVCEAYSIKEDAFYCRPLKKSDDKKLSSVAKYNFEPIPLTEKILLKCGFTEENGKWGIVSLSLSSRDEGYYMIDDMGFTISKPFIVSK